MKASSITSALITHCAINTEFNKIIITRPFVGHQLANTHTSPPLPLRIFIYIYIHEAIVHLLVRSCLAFNEPNLASALAECDSDLLKYWTRRIALPRMLMPVLYICAVQILNDIYIYIYAMMARSSSIINQISPARYVRIEKRE